MLILGLLDFALVLLEQLGDFGHDSGEVRGRQLRLQRLRGHNTHQRFELVLGQLALGGEDLVNVGVGHDLLALLVLLDDEVGGDDVGQRGRNLAQQVGMDNITANAICPGRIVTAMANAVSAEENQKFINNSILKRLGDPEDVAFAAAYLASPRAKFITGETMMVNGGTLRD